MSSSKGSGGGSGGEVRASHILIKHQGSRRPASWKDPEGRIIKNTTRESAVSQLNDLRNDIVSGKANFEDVASRFSDCSSAKRGGDLGQFATLFPFYGEGSDNWKLCCYLLINACEDLVVVVLIWILRQLWFKVIKWDY